jgi:hypothetical protein
VKGSACKNAKVMCYKVAGTCIRQTNVKHFWVEAYKKGSLNCAMQPHSISEPVHAEPSLSEILMTSILPKPEPQPPSEKSDEKEKSIPLNARSLSDAENSPVVKVVKV